MFKSRCARGVLAVAACAWLGLAPGSARAQERDTAAAQALFDQARELVQQGKFAEACPKFQESNRLDPGIGTQFHLADCYEQSGRVASAWALFLDVASQARASAQADREKVGQQRAEKLLPRLPRLTVNVPEGSKLAGLEIRRNGALVGSAQWGTPMPIDPGEVELTISASDKQTLRQTVRLEEGKSFSYSVPLLADAKTPGPPVVAPAPAPAATPARTKTALPPSPQESDSASSSSRAWIIGLGAVGVVGLGLSGTFAVLAKSKYSDSKSECDRDDVNSCSKRGIALRESAITRGNVATVSFIAGGAALAGAGVAWLLSGSSSPKQTGAVSRFRAAPVWTPGSAAFFVQGDY